MPRPAVHVRTDKLLVMKMGCVRPRFIFLLDTSRKERARIPVVRNLLNLPVRSHCSRINPLYIEEANSLPPPDRSPPYPTPSGDCEQNCCKTDYLHANPLREDTLNVLKQNSDFIRSILVSVRLGGCHKRNGLTTIPEGTVDCVPRPVWPCDESLGSQPDATTATRIQKLPKHKYKRWKYDTAAEPTMAPDKQQAKSLPEILRELSASINNAMENADQVEIPPETVLRSLREKINKCLESCMSPHAADAAELSLKDNAIATLSRAFSFVNSFNHGSQDDLEKGRLQLLKRLGRFPGGGEPLYEHVQQPSSSSSSSGTSSSGFSDLTHTPASSNSSASESPPPAGRTTECSETHAVFEKCENQLVAYRDNGVASKISGNCDNAKNTLSFGSFEYRVIPNQTNDTARIFAGAVKGAECLSQTTAHVKSNTLLSVSR